MNQILLNFGTSKEGLIACSAIKQYAQSIGVAQKTLFMMSLYEFMLVNKEYDIADKIAVYQSVDGRRKTTL